MVGELKKYNGAAFLRRIEDLWNEKESKKPELEQVKFSQVLLSKKTDISEETISKWNKATAYPKIENLWKVAAALDCSIEQLLGINDRIIGEMSLERFFKDFYAFYATNGMWAFPDDGYKYLIETKSERHSNKDGSNMNIGSLQFIGFDHKDDDYPFSQYYYDFAGLLEDCHKVMEIFSNKSKEEKLVFQEGIQKWQEMREKRDNYEISDEEYLDWKLNFEICD